ncbi:MAG: chromosomal replication initiator protein DnaA [Lachnospiraceae bacterium]|nr:chromosomal replication initiator protein DnaA [Lachnospiraceae bacterium]
MPDIASKWEFIKNQIFEEYGLTKVSYNTWINPLKFHSVENNKVYIVIPDDNNLKLTYITKSFTDYFKVTISEVMNHEYDDVIFMLEKEIEEEKKEAVIENKVYNINSETANLNAKYKFDTFVVGANNKMAHAASLSVAENPGTSNYNPLYIYGESGLGKTHLMQAIGHYVLETNPDKKVLYVTSEQFTNEIVDCLRSGNANSINKFRDKYRTVDLLMIDDVQFLIGKEATQEEFFHTFNELHSSGKQIILSSDRKPNELTVDERFIGRFTMGLSTFIERPDYETRIAILMRKAETSNINIGRDIINYIAENINSNIRTLEGALNRIIAFSKLNKVEMNVQYAEEALKDLISPNDNKEVTPKYIIEVVAEHYGVTVEDIISKKRTAEISLPRQICMYLCREMTDVSLNEIGAALGNKDHATILHGVKKIENDITSNKELSNKVETIKKKLSPN